MMRAILSNLVPRKALLCGKIIDVSGWMTAEKSIEKVVTKMTNVNNEDKRGPQFSYGLYYGEVILLNWLSKAKQNDEVPPRFAQEYGVDMLAALKKFKDLALLEKTADAYQLTEKGQKLLADHGYFMWAEGKEEFLLSPKDLIRYGEFNVKPPYNRVGSQALDDITMETKDLSKLAVYEDALARLFKDENIIPGIVERTFFSFILQYLGLHGERTEDGQGVRFSATTIFTKPLPVLQQRLGSTDFNPGLYEYVGQRFKEKYGKLLDPVIDLDKEDIAKMITDTTRSNTVLQGNRVRLLKSKVKDQAMVTYE